MADAASLCMLPEDVGECDGENSLKLTRYRYDRVLEICVEFTYSGCRGNSNNFLSLEDCVNRCEQEMVEAKG